MRRSSAVLSALLGSLVVLGAAAQACSSADDTAGAAAGDAAPGDGSRGDDARANGDGGAGGGDDGGGARGDSAGGDAGYEGEVVVPPLDPVDAPMTLVIANGVLYYTIANSVRRVAIAGGVVGAASVVVSNLSQPQGLAVDGADLYVLDWDNGTFADGGIRYPRLLHVPLSAPTPEVLTTFSVHSDRRDLRVDATSLYWIDEGTPTSLYQDGAVMRMPRAGGTPTALVTTLTMPAGLLVDDTRAYFAHGYSSFEVESVTLADAGARTSYDDGAHPRALSFPDATSLLWVTGGQPASVMTAPRAGGAVATNVVDVPGLSAAAVDGSTLYYVDATGGSVAKVALSAGATPVVIASGLKQPHDVAVDGAYVYWLDDAVRRAPK